MSKPIDIQLYNDLCAVEDVLRRDGWCQGVSHDADGRHCLMGAVDVVTRNYGRWLGLQGALGRGMVAFNDHPMTTFEMVLARIKRARDRLVG
jgi:hypothetical protein